MAATTKLIVWNAALREIASAPLVDTTTANTRQYELNAAWDHAVEYVLGLKDWGFARRRSTLTAVADTSFPPYTYRYAKPADYLRKCWIKTSADDEYQTSHAEIAAVFYGLDASAIVEYISDTADNYDPANWPPHFTKVITLYLASLVAPKLARAGAEDLGRLNGQMQTALELAEAQEALFLVNVAIASNRQPVMRRALELMGQSLAGSVPIHSQADKLRWSMNRAWSHTVKYLLEQGAWNFATRRATLTGGGEPVPGDIIDGIIEGYADPPAETDGDDLPDMDGYDYGYLLPSDFLHKIWIKADAGHSYEIPHQFMRDAVYANYEPIVMEYIALDSDSQDPEQWPATFLEAVAAYLALTVAPELVLETDSKGRSRMAPAGIRDKLEAVYRSKLSDAKSKDAIQQFPQTLPPGRFVQARRGGTYSLRRYN